MYGAIYMYSAMALYGRSAVIPLNSILAREWFLCLTALFIYLDLIYPDRSRCMYKGMYMTVNRLIYKKLLSGVGRVWIVVPLFAAIAFCVRDPGSVCRLQTAYRGWKRGGYVLWEGYG